MQRVVYAKSAWIMVWRHWFGWLNWLGIHVKQSVRFRHITATRDLYCICIAVRDDMLYFAIASLHRHISSLPSTYNLLHTSSFLSFPFLWYAGWLNAYKEGGWLPSWASPGYRNCMVRRPPLSCPVLSCPACIDLSGLWALYCVHCSVLPYPTPP